MVGPRLGELSPLAQAEAGMKVRAWKPRGRCFHGITIGSLRSPWEKEDLKFPETSSFWSCVNFTDRNTPLLYTVGLISTLQTKGCHHSLP